MHDDYIGQEGVAKRNREDDERFDPVNARKIQRTWMRSQLNDCLDLLEKYENGYIELPKLTSKESQIGFIRLFMKSNNITIDDL
jgi:hypothetical protein